MVAKITKYGYVFKTSMMDAMVYLLDFFGRSGFFAFILGVYLLLWKNIYGSGDGLIEGFSLNMMIWYLVMTEIVTLSTTNYYKEVAADVKTGNIAYLLNKPYDYILYSFANNMGKITIRIFVNIIVGGGVGLLLVGIPNWVNVWTLPLILFSIVMGIAINFFVNFSLALTAFWVEENSAFQWIYQKLVFTLGGMLLPLELFPEWIEGFSKHLPFAYITYYPGKLFVDFSGDLFVQVMTGQLIYLILAVFICYGVYMKGVKGLNVNGG